MARPQRVHPRRRARVPHLLHQQPRRRSDGRHLELPRHDGARASGDVGGLAGGLPREPTVQVVEVARELRPRRRARPEVGRGVGRRRGRLSETRRSRAGMTGAYPANSIGGASCDDGAAAAARGIAKWLCLAAAPTFAIMALLTGVLGGGPPDMLCSAAQHASPLSGMVPMYLLMSAFHLAPWLKMICRGRSG